MLANRRFGCWFPRIFALAACLSLSVAAQVPSMEFHGVPPSGIGGSLTAFSAVRPQYVGAYGGGAATIGCCASFFFPSSFSPLVPYPSVGSERRTHHHRRRGDTELVGVYEPVYVPYAVPYPVDSEDDEVADYQDEPGPAAGRGSGYPRDAAPAPRTRQRQTATNGPIGIPEEEVRGPGAGAGSDDMSADGTTDAVSQMPADPPEPVVAQPSTVLVYKDGHRSEVVNYAIVGDTLFDFTGDRTHKILIADLDLAATQKVNEAAGVEFKLPPTSGAKSNAN